MPNPLRVLVLTAVVVAGSLAAASLAVARVLPAWAALFFYALPSLFLTLWTLREAVPAVWRRHATPVRRATRLAGVLPAARPSPPPSPPSPAGQSRRRVPSPVLVAAASAWLRLIRRLLESRRSPASRRAVNVAAIVASAAVLAIALRVVARDSSRFAGIGAVETASASALFLSTFALRSLGWQRLFRPRERPRSLPLATSLGIAEVAGIALPSRLDDALAIAAVRKLARRAPAIGTLALGLFLLGLVDMASLAPFAAFATGAVDGDRAVTAALAAVTGICVGAFVLAASIPTLKRTRRVAGYRFGRWLAHHAPDSRGQTAGAWAFVAASWATRITGVYLLLAALALPESFVLATGYVVVGAAASTLPAGPAGAATEAGAGAAILAGSGIGVSDAIALAVVSQLLMAAAGAALAAAGCAVLAAGRRRERIAT